jgi:hypothetical protein
MQMKLRLGQAADEGLEVFHLQIVAGLGGSLKADHTAGLPFSALIDSDGFRESFADTPS